MKMTFDPISKTLNYDEVTYLPRMTTINEGSILHFFNIGKNGEVQVYEFPYTTRMSLCINDNVIDGFKSAEGESLKFDCLVEYTSPFNWLGLFILFAFIALACYFFAWLYGNGLLFR